MVLKEYQLKTVEALILNAETISELYKLYADKFPAYKNFWLDLANEATNQASSIRKLQAKVEDGSVYFNINRFTIQTIESFLRYTGEKINEIKTKDMTIRQAAAIASNIENSVLEKNFFDIFEVDLIELKHLFSDLADATEQRRNKIEQLLETEKSSIALPASNNN